MANSYDPKSLPFKIELRELGIFHCESKGFTWFLDVVKGAVLEGVLKIGLRAGFGVEFPPQIHHKRLLHEA